MAKQRSESERRLRQCQRIARALRVLRLVAGHGRWSPEDIAKELECSVRTVYRDVDVLSNSGIPITYDRETLSYRLQPGFKFPGLTLDPQPGEVTARDLDRLLRSVQSFLAEGRKVAETLEAICRRLEARRPPG